MAKKISDKAAREASRLINLNEDSRQYFYEKADESWLRWLWENGFFDVLRKKADDPTRYSYKSPELHYLRRMVEKKAKLVVDIILEIKISEKNFNPEVIDQFIHICSELPGEQLARVIPKIRDENWPKMMQMYNQWAFDYGKMLEALSSSGNERELLKLAEVVLGLREDWKSKAKVDYYNVSVFCLGNLSYTNVYHHLANVSNEFVEEAFALTFSILKKLTLPSGEIRSSESIFSRMDISPLFDVDLFRIELRSNYRSSERDDIKELVATLKKLVQRLISSHCKSRGRDIYQQYFITLPDSWLMWRLKLFVLSLCPDELLLPLEEAIFSIFGTERYSDLIRGAEYKHALKVVFPLMSDKKQSAYIEQAMKLFDISQEEELNSKIIYGSTVFSIIADYLSDEQTHELVAAGFQIDPTFEPKPMAGMLRGGFVKAKGPIGSEEFHNLPIRQIIDNLVGVWSPAQIVELDTQKDFLQPLNAEGMGQLIKEDVKTRLRDYLKFAQDFLKPANLDMHYTYSLITGLDEAIDSGEELFGKADWDLIINFCIELVNKSKNRVGEKREYEVNYHDAWLGRWDAVHTGVISLLQKVLGEPGIKKGFKWEDYRSHILKIIEYYFGYPDPTVEDEQLDSAKITETVGNQGSLVSDPFTTAINSIRGRCFELLVQSVNLDKRREADIKLAADIKLIYENLLSNEDTRAIKFMFGRYLPTFFYGDKTWLKRLLKDLFPVDRKRHFLYLAAWEGYLTNNLFFEIFSDQKIQNLYKRAISLTEKHYPNQKHFTDPDEALAHHFALAYMFTDFSFGNDLFDEFLQVGTLDQHSAFVEKLGGFFISGENPRARELLNQDKVAAQKLKDIWLWFLENFSDQAVFDGIGFWIDLEKGIFQPDELASLLVNTLVQTNGYLKWDIGLQENIALLAKYSPENTLRIARLYLLEGGVKKQLNSLHFILDEKWKKAFSYLYSFVETREETSVLINELIKDGGQFFWPLKEVLEDD